ncbi:hypothetical protein Mpet_0968 [Methanolacinia petrolearia DSM 11571]|uniref:Uncharacterized protein n=1 Tax=Methanolacinia petrolearia (strain DSM 11571 / OCM 486 / SEBR 4847) TaxID=679926 RepID=E1RK12_METP4|nr:hypothetical protein [Methanolacinia petrolearia]ADN35735.1 hypothetical protein Mpet_0968 [Methanolacinia petrolearia DSM 11571]
MDPNDIQKNYQVIDAASHDLLQFFGPKFTSLPKGHIETDISAAASLGGLMVLRHQFPGIGSWEERGTVAYQMDEELKDMRMFINGACGSLNLDPNQCSSAIPDANQPVYSVPEMTHKIEKDFLAICRDHDLEEDYYPFVALLTALKLVAAGKKMSLLDQKIGIALTIYYYIAGAKTIPYPQED